MGSNSIGALSPNLSELESGSDCTPTLPDRDMRKNQRSVGHRETLIRAADGFGLIVSGHFALVVDTRGATIRALRIANV